MKNQNASSLNQHSEEFLRYRNYLTRGYIIGYNICYKVDKEYQRLILRRCEMENKEWRIINTLRVENVGQKRVDTT